MLALNITNRPFSGLLQPLDYHQAAPIGFLVLEKLVIETFGNSEYTLRLVPFLSGIISLFLFYEVAKRYIRPKAVPIALGLFAISNPLIYYSVEVKQYSSDVAIAVLLYLVVTYIQSKRLTTPRIALLAAVGGTAIWFSYPSVFILAGVGVSLALFYLSRKQWTRIGGLIIAYSLWALSLIACYFVSLRDLSSHETLLKSWAHAFMPFPPFSSPDARWFVSTFFGIFENPVGLSLAGIAALTFLVGCTSIFLEKKSNFFILISPILLALLVSGFRKYPFKGRLLLFMVPSMLLFVGEGAEQIRKKIKHNSAIIGIILIGLLFFHPLCSAIYHLTNLRFSEQIKPVMNYLREHQQDRDVLYLYHGSQAAFKYYSERYGFNDNNYIVGISSTDHWRNYLNDLDKLRGNKRVWMLFSHVYNLKGVDEEKFFLYYLDSIGTRLDFLKSVRAAVYLYDLS